MGPIKKLLAVIYFFLNSLTLFAQITEFTLGKDELKSVGKRYSLFEKAATGKYLFHARIGGISFEQIAVPENNFNRSTIIFLHYDPKSKSGEHLRIEIKDQFNTPFYVSLPDWQLIPIAKYANDENNAVFTLFSDPANDSDGTAYSYHPAFDSTLLGLRMFQADLLFGYEPGELPRDKKDNLLLADSEHPLVSTFYYSKSVYDIYEDLSIPLYSSYILTDWAQEFKFGVYGNQFYITGEPYYLFTSNVRDNFKTTYRKAQLISQLEGKYPFTNDSDYIALESYVANSILTEFEISDICLKISNLCRHYNEPFKSWFNSLNNALMFSENADDIKYIVRDIHRQLTSLHQTSPLLEDPSFISLSSTIKQNLYSWSPETMSNSLDNLLYKYPKPFSNWLSKIDEMINSPYSLDTAIEEPKVELLLCDSKRIQQQNRLIFEYNPVVFNSCILTARYASFFRYVKKNNPQGWRVFMSEINALNRPAPSSDPKNPTNQLIVPPNSFNENTKDIY